MPTGDQSYRLRKVTDDQLPELVRDYQSGMTVAEVRTKWGIGGNTLTKYIRKAGAAVPYSAVRYRGTGREDAFANAEDDPVAAYWAGMLMADGHFIVAEGRRKTPGIKLSLSGEDGAHVLDFQRWLGWSLRPRVYRASCLYKGTRHKGEDATVFIATSTRLLADLASYGIVPRKTWCARARRLQWNRYFWLGVLCGDGGIEIRKGKYADFSICGTKELMQQFADFVRKDLGMEFWPRQRTDCNWSVAGFGWRAAPLIRHLFAGASFAMPRKLAVASEIMDRYPLQPERTVRPGRRVGPRPSPLLVRLPPY